MFRITASEQWYIILPLAICLAVTTHVPLLDDAGEPIAESGGGEGLALARAALLIGRLDGAVSQISPEIRHLFAIRSVRRAFQTSLAAAGQPVSLGALTGWIARTHAAPAAPDATRVPADALVAVVLDRLQRWPWPPLADAAALVARACPQLLRPLDRTARADLARVLAEADTLFDTPALPAPTLPVAALLAAHAHPDFVDGERGTATIASPTGAVVIETRGAIAHVWALGLAAPAALARASWSRGALPLFGSVPRRCLRPGLGPEAVTRHWAEALAYTAEASLSDLDDALQMERHARGALTTRRHSRAIDAWALLAGLGALRRSQLAAALGLTLAGADQALARLSEAGLIRRPDSRGPYIATTTSPAPAPPRAIAAPPSQAAAEVDAALADIDRLLGNTDEEA
jgi:hypothetical protein